MVNKNKTGTKLVTDSSIITVRKVTQDVIFLKQKFSWSSVHTYFLLLNHLCEPKVPLLVWPRFLIVIKETTLSS